MNNLLKTPLVLHTRRNHALEHATIHLLSARFPDRPLAGHSNPTGFFIIGDIPTEHIRQAVTEALTRLQNGERRLAIHPGCGTNYALSGGLAAWFAFFAMSGTRTDRERWERLPIVAVFAVLAFLIGQRLGPGLQNSVTTEPEPGELTIVDIYPLSRTVHRIITRS
ncbi:MAG: DUF6391 domain-containing protein [Anaerolineales bacterium]|nr:DUF6391 domain-containing protein [Anaerolineales bacterium]MCX7756030.1 DUF6391 domain-containing protein [Anaerolineales bacterium]MDW8277038.1 DUF6391 domain-containing protein [Anaerolineales bacterium]